MRHPHDRAAELATVCCICQRRRTASGAWTVAPPDEKGTPGPVSHGYCPDCFRMMMTRTLRHRRRMAAGD